MENERVTSFATRQHIRPASPINPILASQTIDGIAAGGANKIIIARSADNISRRWRRRRSNIIISDGADTLTVADGGAVGRIRQIDVEGLVWLDLGVAVDP